MSTGPSPSFIPGGATEIVKILASPFTVHFYPDGAPRFAHRCDRGDRGVIWCAPLLFRHTVDRGSMTVTPSVLCADCGTHGFITNGQWVPA